MWKIPAPGRRHRQNTNFGLEYNLKSPHIWKGLFPSSQTFSLREEGAEEEHAYSISLLHMGKKPSVPVSRDSKEKNKRGRENKNKQSPPPISPPRRSLSTWRGWEKLLSPWSSSFQSERLGMWFSPESLLPGCLLQT